MDDPTAASGLPLSPRRYLAGAIVFIAGLAVAQTVREQRHVAKLAAVRASITAVAPTTRPATISGVTAGGLIVDLKRLGYGCRPHSGDDGHVCSDGESEVVVLRGADGWAKLVSCSIESGGTYPWTKARAKCDPMIDLVYESDKFLGERVRNATLSWKGQRIAVEDGVSNFVASHSGDTYSFVFTPGAPSR